MRLPVFFTQRDSTAESDQQQRRDDGEIEQRVQAADACQQKRAPGIMATAQPPKRERATQALCLMGTTVGPAEVGHFSGQEQAQQSHQQGIGQGGDGDEQQAQGNRGTPPAGTQGTAA